MDAKRYKKLKRILLITLAALITIVVFVISFANSNNIPDWNDIYRSMGLLPEEEKADFVRFLDVGQGDSILISSNGYNAVIDTGPSESADELIEELKKENIEEIDVLLLTHLHFDHVGGIEQLIENFKIKNLIIPDLTSGLEGYAAGKAAKESVIAANGGVFRAQEGMKVDIGDFEITVLGYYPEMKEENDRSIITAAKIEDFRFLFMADAHEGTESRLILEGINVDSDVIKIGHHGSKTSSDLDFLKTVSPDYAVISVGADNSYNHPNGAIITRLESLDAEVYRTDNNGSITFYIEDGELKPLTEYKN